MSIKLEVGKYYRTRNGLKKGPITLDDHVRYPAEDPQGTAWTADGFFYGPNDPHHLDLIAEWTDEPSAEPATVAPQPNRYARTINGATVDVYDILRAFNVTCPATQHAVKKLLMPGQRGGKSVTQDLREAMASVRRAIDMAGE